MGNFRKVTALSIAMLVAFSFNVRAGDYYSPGPADDAPEVTVVEFGTGWYLRGDVGYTDAIDPDFSLGGTATGLDLGNANTFGIGAGYQVNQFFRIDGTLEQFANLGFSDRRVINCGTWDDPATTLVEQVPIGGSCNESQAMNIGATTVMLNAYFDLGNFAGFTPYVGAGAGAAYVRWEDYTLVGTCEIAIPSDCQNGTGTLMYTPVTYPGNTEWKAAGSVMAGFAYDLTKNLKLDLGYKFTYIGGGSAVDNIPNGASFANLNYDSFQIHQVRVGLRYEIW